MSVGSTPGRRWIAGALVVMAAIWATTATGLISSNDGSHLALARALALRGETAIDLDADLTLWVDRARRGERQYSDRPPGTAFLAIPAVWLGSVLDPPLLRRSVENRDIVVVPASARYAHTHNIRTGGRRPLRELQGTALALKVHTAIVGVAGLAAIMILLGRLGSSVGARLFAALAIGLGTLWGPYSTTLFSHVTAGSCLAAALVLAVVDRERPRPWSAALVGLAGGWGVASDYLLILAVAPLVAVAVVPRRWPWVFAGVVPIAVATAAYHAAAFGSPWAIGYDFHANFDFARSRTSTFDQNPMVGLWVLIGAGRGAGLLVQSPVVLAGIVALAMDTRTRRWGLALVPWVIVLGMHHTPYGGATEDHRYLIPALPLAAVGLASAWDRASSLSRAVPLHAGLAALAAASTALVWLHFFTWRG